MGKKVQKNFLMGLKIWWSWGSSIFFSKSQKVGRFSIFHAKLQLFVGLGALFRTFFWHFLVIFSCKNSVFSEAGRSFWVKKDNFFMQNFSFWRAGWSFWYLFCYFSIQKFSFLGGWVLFLSKKMTIFWDFLENVARRLVSA